MPEGVIGGGWAYVIAVYSISIGALVVYSWSLRRRLRSSGEPPREEEP